MAAEPDCGDNAQMLKGTTRLAVVHPVAAGPSATTGKYALQEERGGHGQR